MILPTALKYTTKSLNAIAVKVHICKSGGSGALKGPRATVEAIPTNQITNEKGCRLGKGHRNWVYSFHSESCLWLNDARFRQIPYNYFL